MSIILHHGIREMNLHQETTAHYEINRIGCRLCSSTQCVVGSRLDWLAYKVLQLSLLHMYKVDLFTRRRGKHKYYCMIFLFPGTTWGVSLPPKSSDVLPPLRARPGEEQPFEGFLGVQNKLLKVEEVEIATAETIPWERPVAPEERSRISPGARPATLNAMRY
jgi:hypothetical protein